MVRIYMCENCGNYKPDVIKYRGYKPAVESHLQTIILCNECKKHFYLRGWTFLKCI